MQNGIYPVKVYNTLMTVKYHKDCQNYDLSKGGFPQIVFYLFEQKTGFVLVNDKIHHWYKTKKEAITLGCKTEFEKITHTV